MPLNTHTSRDRQTVNLDTYSPYYENNESHTSKFANSTLPKTGILNEQLSHLQNLDIFDG